MIKNKLKMGLVFAFIAMIAVVGTADAAYNDVKFSVDTNITVGSDTLVVSANSQVEAMTVNASTVDITLRSNSNITFTSTAGKIMQLNYSSAGTNACDSTGTSTLAVIYDPAHPTVQLSLTGDTCSGTGLPTVSTAVIATVDTMTITMSEKIKYISGTTASSTELLAGTTFDGITPISVSTIDGSSASFTLTFTAGALATAAESVGVMDDASLLVMPAAVLEDNDGADLAAVSQVLTDLATINQLYDFVFAIQVGQNFMSIPYDVDTTLDDSYTDPSSGIITVTTIGNSGGGDAAFATASSYSVLHGYYINSTAPSTVYLRLKKSSSQSLMFSRTFSAKGWHQIGIASNNASSTLAAAANVGGTAILSTLESNYDKVVDLSVGITNDDNAGGVGGATDGTYDATPDVYKALLTDAYIVTKTKTQIDAVTSGIEFNHGECYFIYINAQNAVYTGEKVSTGNLIL